MKRGREQLPNSPLEGVACEARFVGDLSLLTKWGQIQEKLRDGYPKLLIPGGQLGQPPLLQPFRISTKTDDRVVLFGLNLFSLTTNSYTTYDDFRGHFADAYGAFREIYSLPPVTRLGLQYSNVLPSADEHDEQWVHPYLKLGIAGLEGRWNTQPQMVLETRHEGGFALRVTLGRAAAPRQKINEVVLDPGVRLVLECFNGGETPPDAVLTTMDSAHDIVENVFFSIITDEYLKYLKGEE